jgi:predicted O-methyltransferase YrrM
MRSLYWLSLPFLEHCIRRPATNMTEIYPAETIQEYIVRTFCPDALGLASILAEAERQGFPPDHISPLEGQLVSVLLDAVGATRVIEIGTLAGYSAAWMVRGSDRIVISIDRNQVRTEFAAQLAEVQGRPEKTQFITGDALEVLANIEGQGPFDGCLIDADWGNYPRYVTWAIDNVRSGGWIFVHNSLYFGIVHLDARKDAAEFAQALASDPALFQQWEQWPTNLKEELLESLTSVQEANSLLATDPRCECAMVPTADGLLMALRR